MATPSILIVPDRYKSGVLYSQLPETGAVDFGVTRATPAFRTNASGVSESVASGVPRLDYPAAGGCPALLVEPAATNSIRNNSMQGAVTGTPGTLPTNWIEISGGLTREIVGVGTENGAEYIDLRYSGTATAASMGLRFETATQITASNGQSWAHSLYAKTINSQPNSFALGSLFYSSGSVFLGSQIAVRTITGTLSRIEHTTVLSSATVASIQPTLIFNLTSGSTYDFTIRIGWPQMELGSVATSPIRTTTAAVTRNADVISKTGVSGFIGQTEGTIYAEVDFTNVAAGRFLSLNDGSVANRILLARNSNNSVSYLITVSSVTQVSITSSILTNGVHRFAAAYQSGSFAFYIDGTLIGTASSGTIPTCSRIDVGNEVNANQFNDRIRAAAIYTTRLSNTELAALTSL